MPETRHAFHEELARLEVQALGALDMIVTALGRALEALRHRDVELAQIVISDDDRIDGRYLEVHQGILTLLATQAPVATDLRTVAALLHVIKHVERMGDLAISEVRQAKQAFLLRDVDLAEDLVRQDEEINKLNRDVFRMGVAAGGSDEDRLEWVLTMVMVARAIERIGDNAVDIGEQVAFVVTGLFREFSDASHPLPR